jgi:hypothetical protein
MIKLFVYIIIIIIGLFNDTVSSSNCIVLNDTVISESLIACDVA